MRNAVAAAHEKHTRTDTYVYIINNIKPKHVVILKSHAEFLLQVTRHRNKKADMC